MERYNELYDKQNDEDFGKPAYRLSAIRTAPFYGCWLGASLLTTEQGIAINEKDQALDTNNQPMEGLYIMKRGGPCLGPPLFAIFSPHTPYTNPHDCAMIRLNRRFVPDNRQNRGVCTNV